MGRMGPSISVRSDLLNHFDKLLGVDGFVQDVDYFLGILGKVVHRFPVVWFGQRAIPVRIVGGPEKDNTELERHTPARRLRTPHLTRLRLGSTRRSRDKAARSRRCASAGAAEADAATIAYPLLRRNRAAALSALRARIRGNDLDCCGYSGRIAFVITCALVCSVAESTK